MTTILALDVSSTAIGWCYLQPDQPPLARSIALGKGDIADRCLLAQQQLAILIAACSSIDAVAIEDYVWMSANSTIPQACVRGAVYAELRAHGLTYCLVAPSTAKKALTGCGDAHKLTMVQMAAEHLGYDPAALEYICKRSLWYAYQGDECVYDEHAADALGIGLAARGRVEVCEVVG